MTFNLSETAETVLQLVVHLPAHVPACPELRKPKKEEGKEFVASLYQWLNNKRRNSVHQFIQTEKADHFVCVDERRRLIWDNEEKLPLELSAGLLRLCSGVRSKKARFHVMEMVPQREKKKTNGVLKMNELH